MGKGQGSGGARKGAGRKSKNPYVKRKTASWNVEEWIPKALQHLAKLKGIKSTSDIVNEALQALCYVHGLQALNWSSSDPDLYQTARWRFFSDDEMREIQEALADRRKYQGQPKDGTLHDVWLSAWQALEPQENVTSWRHSILDGPAATPLELPETAAELAPGTEQGAQSSDAAEHIQTMDLDAIEAMLVDFEQSLTQDDIENLLENQ